MSMEATIIIGVAVGVLIGAALYLSVRKSLTKFPASGSNPEEPPTLSLPRNPEFKPVTFHIVDPYKELDELVAALRKQVEPLKRYLGRQGGTVLSKKCLLLKADALNYTGIEPEVGIQIGFWKEDIFVTKYIPWALGAPCPFEPDTPIPEDKDDPKLSINARLLLAEMQLEVLVADGVPFTGVSNALRLVTEARQQLKDAAAEAAFESGDG